MRILSNSILWHGMNGGIDLLDTRRREFENFNKFFKILRKKEDEFVKNFIERLKLPSYPKGGTTEIPQGMAIVGERGYELVVSKLGNQQFPSNDILDNLEKEKQRNTEIIGVYQFAIDVAKKIAKEIKKKGNGTS